MCLAVPMKLIKKEGDMGTVELGGIERQISLMLMPDARLGEYLIVHAGFAIQRLDEEEAHKTLELLAQMGDIDPELNPNSEESDSDKAGEANHPSE